MTRPLQQLAVAAERIAEGNLARPIHVSGDDEVARVGSAFESMRVRLRDQMEDLSLLLETSEAVAATLELSTGMPSILMAYNERYRCSDVQYKHKLKSNDPHVCLHAGI